MDMLQIILLVVGAIYLIWLKLFYKGKPHVKKMSWRARSIIFTLIAAVIFVLYNVWWYLCRMSFLAIAIADLISIGCFLPFIYHFAKKNRGEAIVYEVVAGLYRIFSFFFCFIGLFNLYLPLGRMTRAEWILKTVYLVLIGVLLYISGTGILKLKSWAWRFGTIVAILMLSLSLRLALMSREPFVFILAFFVWGSSLIYLISPSGRNVFKMGEASNGK